MLNYLRFLGCTFALVLGSVALLNVTVDPGGVYHHHGDQAMIYADRLVKSRYGLWWPENTLDERSIKKALTRYAGRFDCVVVGSSHVMQIGSERPTTSLSTLCNKILNLGVSGAGIEDQMALAYLVMQSEPGRPRKILFGIDPWTFAFGKDERWSFFAQEYQAAQKIIMERKEALSSGTDLPDTGTGKFKNLLSLQYTVRSIEKLFSGNAAIRASNRVWKDAPQIDEDAGGEHPVLFPDGSLQYSFRYIADSSKRQIRMGGDVYKTDGVLNDPHAIEMYKLLIEWVRRNGVEPLFLLTPYHHNVWQLEDSLNARALRATTQVVNRLADEMHVPVIGSYDPVVIGCAKQDFFDYMHAKPACLDKLETVLRQ